MSGDRQLVPLNMHVYGKLFLHERLGVSINKIEKFHGAAINGLLTSMGWTVVSDGSGRATSDLEKRTAIALAAYGLTPPMVKQEMPFGRFRADFAIPSAKVAIEVDGIHHLADDVAEKDQRKAKFIESQGWLVRRIDCKSGATAKETIPRQVADVVEELSVLNLIDYPLSFGDPDQIKLDASAALGALVAGRPGLAP